MRLKILSSLALIMITGQSLHAQDKETTTLLTRKLDEGEAIVWYLYHSGWAVKTMSNFMIFDYWDARTKPAHPSLSKGFINSDELEGLNVSVIVSHRHGDHYDPVVLEWENDLEQIKYIFGWKALEDPNHHYFHEEREHRQLGGINIYNVHHTFDNIPESAFLIEVDGVTLYFAGDHGHRHGEKNPIFKGNIDYLAGLGKEVDLFFTHGFGGVDYSIDQLKPTIIFPMHDGGRERQYKKFADRYAGKWNTSKIIAASQPGDCFFFSNGNVKSITQ